MYLVNKNSPHWNLINGVGRKVQWREKLSRSLCSGPHNSRCKNGTSVIAARDNRYGTSDKNWSLPSEWCLSSLFLGKRNSGKIIMRTSLKRLPRLLRFLSCKSAAPGRRRFIDASLAQKTGCPLERGLWEGRGMGASLNGYVGPHTPPSLQPPPSPL